tara:strand:- start:838 stop:1383 length:546 start_codon:yes stop_codon:yes gene_type:complete
MKALETQARKTKINSPVLNRKFFKEHFTKIQIRVDVVNDSKDLVKPSDSPLWKKFAKKVIQDVGPKKRPLEMCIHFLEEDAIAILNEEHLNKPGPTDVLAFPVGNLESELEEVPFLLGDVFVCPSFAKIQAIEKKYSLENEIALLIVHGILHLLGFDHVEESETIKMKKTEKLLLDRYYFI